MRERQQATVCRNAQYYKPLVNQFNVGQWVWLFDPRITPGSCDKLMSYWIIKLNCYRETLLKWEWGGWLQGISWFGEAGGLKQNIQCIACGSFLTLRAMNDRDKMGWRCLNYGCDKRNHTVSVRIQSFFSGSKLTLKDKYCLNCSGVKPLATNRPSGSSIYRKL